MTDVIGCVRVEDSGMVTLGSVQRMCLDCGAAIWVAPTGVDLIENVGVRPVCMFCMGLRAQRDPGARRMPMTPGQIAEAMATITHHRRRN